MSAKQRWRTRFPVVGYNETPGDYGALRFRKKKRSKECNSSFKAKGLLGAASRSANLPKLKNFFYRNSSRIS